MKLSRTKQIILFSLCGIIILVFISYAAGLFSFLEGGKKEVVESSSDVEQEDLTSNEPDDTTLPEDPEPQDEEVVEEPTVKTVEAPVMAELPNESTVSIVQSGKANAADIDYTEIKDMVREAITLAGGFEELIKDGSTVILKPNLVEKKDFTLPGWNGRPLETEVNGVTTDWRVTKAVVELVRELNPSGKVYVMEGSAGNTKDHMNHLNFTPEFIQGVDEFIAIEQDSGNWHDYVSPSLVKVLLPNGLLHKEYYLNKRYQEADVVISLPTLKNHWHAAVTGAIKNVSIGATPASIYGSGPGNSSRINMFNHESASGEIHKWIHDFYMCRPVDYVIMDGLQGIQNGPTPSYANSGVDDIKKAQMNMRLILAGKDAVAVDTVESLVVGWDPQSVGYLNYLGESLAGYSDPSRINVVGKPIDQVRKYFDGTIPPSGGEKITVQEPPTLAIAKSSVKDGYLNLSLNVSDDTIKAAVYIDDVMYGSYITSNYSDISIDIGPTGKGKHKVKIYTYDRFFNRAEKSISITNDVAKRAPQAPNGDYIAARANKAPIIDGVGNDTCWQTVPWSPINHVWLGDTPSPDDFTGRYKMVWTPDKLYYLVEIIDDVLSNTRTDPLDNYYNDDCLELFIDEDNSGGDHTYDYNAFAYHIKTDYNIVDLDVSKKPVLLNDHAEVKWTKKGTTYTWEVALDIYDSSFVYQGTDNQKVILSAGKELGFAIAYCDADETGNREHFIGSIDIPGSDKNVAWQNASVFGTLKLIEME